MPIVQSRWIIGKGILHPEVMVTYVGWLDSAAGATLNLTKVPGGKRLVYTHVSMPMTAIAAVRASEELGVPFILQHALVHEPYLPLAVAGPIMLQLARAAKMPVAVHLDHGTSVAHCLRALAMGFTSVMFDGSALPFEENVAATDAIVDDIKRVMHVLSNKAALATLVNFEAS